jgi:SAM-dependent methyltransferase
MRTLSANPSHASEATERVIPPHPFGDAILALGAPTRTTPLWRQLAPSAVGPIAAIYLIGQVRKLPFDPGTFDLVTAIETHYYWPDLAGSMQEIRRVLKPGGTLIVIAESYRGSRFDKLQRVVMKPLKSAHLTVDEHRELFLRAGYSDVRVVEHRGKGWIRAIGRAPAVVENIAER